MADENQNFELFAPEGDPSIGFKAFEILGEVLNDKNNLGLPDKWMRNYQLAKNKHWKGKTDKATLITANLLFTHRTRTVNLLTDNNPTFNLSQQGNPDTTDQEVYDSLLHTAEHWWIEEEQQNVLEKSVTNGETNGCCVEKVVFNHELANGIGEVETEVVDPFHFGLYPVKTKEVQKSEAVLHFRPMAVREIKRRWPEFADHIKADDEILKELGDQRREVQGGKKSGPAGYFSTFAGVVKNMLNISGDADSDRQESLLVEVWVKDSTKNEFGVPLYPGNIRVIQTCSAGNVILSDRGNPSINPELPQDQAEQTYLYDRFPFSFTQSLTDPVNIWSMSDYEQLEGLQLEIDKSLSQITLYKDSASRLKIINPLDSGVSNDQFTTTPGVINPSSSLAAQAIRYMDPPRPPGELISTLEVYKDFFFLVAGTFDLESAKSPGRDVIAAKAIAALIERAHTMLKGKIRNYTKMIRERGRMYLSHVMNFYTEERWITYEDEGEDVTSAIYGNKMIVPGKLTVVSGSTMPVSKIQQREEALELYKMGAIDAQELLKRLEWPDRKNVVKRLMHGPLGALMERLELIGFPPEMIQIMTEIANMDDKEFESELKLERLPSFMELLPEMGEPQADPMQNLELNEKNVEIQKIQADIGLIQEKILTERAEQAVKFAGITFDEATLKIKRAEVVADLENKARDDELAAIKTVAELDAQEHGQDMDKDNAKKDKEGAKTEQSNKTEDRKLENRKIDVAEKGITSKAESKGTPPYREKGLKSNNKKT